MSVIYYNAITGSTNRSTAPITPDTFDSILVYVGGQSNGAGVAPGPPVAPYNDPITNALIFTGNQFDTLEYNVNNDAHTTGVFGCELSLGYKLAELFGDTIYMCKYAVSNKGLSQNPTKEVFHPYSYQLFPNVASSIQMAYDYMVNTLGKNPMILGVWLQGESDTSTLALAEAYYSSFDIFRLKLNQQITSIKWYLNLLGIGQRLVYNVTNFDAVRLGQENIIAKYPDVRAINLDDKPYNPDGIHYNADGQIGIGNEIAQDIYDNYSAQIITL